MKVFENRKITLILALVASVNASERASAEQPDPIFKATALERQGDWAGALQEYKKLLQKNPNDTVALIDRGNLLFRTGNVKAAFEDVNNALKINMIDSEALRTRADFKAAGGDKKGALADYNEALKWNPKDAYAYVNRGILRESSGEKSLALHDFDMAYSLDHDITAQFHRLLLLPNHDTARTEYETLIKAGPNLTEPDDYLALSNLHAHFGNKEKAIAALNLSISRNASYAVAYFNRAVLRAEAGDEKGALADYDKYIELNKSNPKAYYNRSLLKERMNDREGSMNDLKRALELDPQLKLRQADPKPFSLLMS